MPGVSETVPQWRCKRSDDTDGESGVSLTRMTVAVARVVAGHRELEIVFTPGPLRLDGDIAYLPSPSQPHTQQDVIRVRGQADALALRYKHQHPHIRAVGSALPQPAQEMFAVLEQARCEALSTGVLLGVDHNLQAALDQHL